MKRKDTWRGELDQWLQGEVDTRRSNEYAANIFNAMIGDHSLFKFNGNVLNHGLVDNLPQGSCVEVPVLASRHGLEPIHVGPMPAHLAALVGLTASWRISSPRPRSPATAAPSSMPCVWIR